MNRKLLVILTVILVMAFAVPAFASLTGLGGVKDQTPAANAGIVCNPGACQQACGGDPAVCAQGGCDKANCPNAGICGTGAACGTGNCSSAAQQGCGGGGCGGGGCGSVAPNVNQ